ncbi:MAG: selenocysteine synthase [Acidobacteria bacterium]|nr:selenocysteine synthase [Acidobacteriota bacterium]
MIRCREEHILSTLTPMSQPRSKSVETNASILRALPSVDELLRSNEAQVLRRSVGTQRLTTLARSITAALRLELQNNFESDHSLAGDLRDSLLSEAVRRLKEACEADQVTGVGRVINATGVILHTNLGRAPLSETAREALNQQARGYCALEYDLTTGERGRRGGRVEDLLVELTGAEAALVVNNCAAAALLILTVLAGNGETIVSRGELVEIGGDFRVPDVMATSGTLMVEVGTTNRTKLEDYRRALNEKTRLIMRVHPSNYRIVGFTATPSVAELSGLAKEAGLPLYEDAGSGVLRDLSEYKLADEPIISVSLSSGADVVSFSGDKLLGACQAGLIVGRREIVSLLRKHPLYRALRADKLSLAVLEKTLESHRRERASEEVPVLRMLALTKDQIAARAGTLIEKYRQDSVSTSLTLEICDGESAIGGGAGATTHPETALISISHQKRSADQLAAGLRRSQIPIVCRIAEGKVIIDLRTVAPDEEPQIVATLLKLAK